MFVNIIDNALFWLKDVVDSRLIELDADNDGYLISNTGPSINQRDYTAIFEQGFTRKPGGRGLGLFISRKALRREGMDVEVLTCSGKRGVTMKLKWPETDDAT